MEIEQSQPQSSELEENQTNLQHNSQNLNLKSTKPKAKNDPFEEIAINRIVCSPCLTNGKCNRCQTNIAKGDIQVHNKITPKKLSSRTHLRCFKPRFHSHIKKEDIDTTLLSQENKRRVQEWVKHWNSRFSIQTVSFLSTCKTTTTFSSKNIADERLKRKKFPLLLIFTFLDLKEVILNIALVSKYFYWLTFRDILWKEFCFIFYSSQDINEIIDTFYKKYKNDINDWHWKEIYMLLFQNCCWECKKLDHETMRTCPILKKPLCENCRKKEKFQLISLSQVNRYYGGYLTHHLNYSNLKFCDSYKEKQYFYKFYIEKCVKSIKKISKVNLKKTKK